MKVGIVSEKNESDLQDLSKAFEREGLETGFIGLKNIGLFTEKTGTRIFFGEDQSNGFDAVFLEAIPQFTQFVEPFLDELIEKGIYCQLKPDSFFLISNKPFQYSALNSKGIKIARTVISASPMHFNGFLSDFSYPVIFKSFKGLQNLQNILVESERGLKSLLKSIKSKVDAITIQEYLEGELYLSLVVGEEVFTVKRAWNENELEHSKKGVSFKLADTERETVIRATKVVGADIAVVKMIKGTVIGISQLVDFDFFKKALGTDVYSIIARFYAEKLKGE